VAFGLDKAGGCPFPIIAVHDLPREPTKNPASPPNTTLTPSTVTAITQTNRRREVWWAFSGDLAQLGTEACWVAARLAGRPRFDAGGSGSGGGGTDNGVSGKAASSDMGRGLSASSKYADAAVDGTLSSRKAWVPRAGSGWSATKAVASATGIGGLLA
jgi:hypothetical protein